MQVTTDGALHASGIAELAVARTKRTNAEVPPEWIELIPAGEFMGRDGRGPFRLSNSEQVIASTKALQMDAGLPIDYDHATDFGAPEGRPAPAAGWICGLENRAGALWGKVEWTAHGGDAITTREYRYISPVFEHTANGEVLRLLRAALTNNPNLYLTAISALDPQSDQTMDRIPTSREKTEHMETFGDEIKKLLGLPAEASTEAVLAAIQALVNARDGKRGAGDVQSADKDAPDDSRNGDPSRFVPMAQFETVLTELNQLSSPLPRASRASCGERHT
jgi:phage I-like protein